MSRIKNSAYFEYYFSETGHLYDADYLYEIQLHEQKNNRTIQANNERLV